MKKRSNKTLAYYFILIWVVAAFLLESSDLWISIKVYNPNAYWAILLEKYGEIPGLVVALIGIHIYTVTIKTSSNIKAILFTGFLLTTSSLITIYIFWLLSLGITNGFAFFEDHRNYFFLAAILINIFISVFYRRKQNYSKKTILFSRVSFKMFLYGNLIFVTLVKFIWGRVRFRDLAEGYSNFTAWYIPNGFNGHQSFPSGHAAMGFMLLSLFVLISDKSFLKRILIKGLIISYSITVSISRIIIGAHDTSDVLFGAFIMIVTYLFIINNGNRKINTEEN